MGAMLKTKGYKTALFGKWHVGLSFLDRSGAPINENGFEPIRKIDYTRSIPDAPIHRGFDHFFGTACCPTTDFLYAFIFQFDYLVGELLHTLQKLDMVENTLVIVCSDNGPEVTS